MGRSGCQEGTARGRPMTAQEKRDLWASRMSCVIARIMWVISRHWLLLANVALGAFFALPFLAPVLSEMGHERASGLIHTLFFPLCHQLPERSFFLFGPRWVYSRSELVTLVGAPVSLRYAGEALIGHKAAVCQRCAALYGGWFLFGVFFGLVRHKAQPLGIRSFLALLVPMAIDGLGQFVGLWASTVVSRIITGMFFGLAVVWLTYPYLEVGMRDMHREAHSMILGERA